MIAHSPRRRALVAFTALVLAAPLVRGPLADALVTRGDDAWHAGDPATAVRSYRKAVAIDPASAVAADRLAFQLALHHDRASAAEGIAIARRGLREHPRDPALLADLALAELQLRHAGRTPERGR